MTPKKLFPLAIIFLSFLSALCFYPTSPAVMVTHWGLYGQADGYTGKFFVLFFMPILSVFLYLILRFLPKTDPYHSHFKEFEKYYDTFINILFIFLFYIYFLSLIWNLVAEFNIVQFLSPAFALLIYYAGILCSVAKRNWFVGIRTPWTMSSDTVWKKTHQFGAFLFKFTAILSLLGIIWPSVAIYFIIFPILFSAFAVFVYSYLAFRQEQNP